MRALKGHMTFGHYMWRFMTSLPIKRPPLWRILHNFRLRMRTPKGTPDWVTWSLVTFGSPVGHVQRYYCTTTLVRKKRGETIAHAQNVLLVTSCQGLFWSRDWRHFRSRDFWLRHFRSSMRNGQIIRKCDLCCVHILLWPNVVKFVSLSLER
jgi:hypothetical protein